MFINSLQHYMYQITRYIFCAKQIYMDSDCFMYFDIVTFNKGVITWSYDVRYHMLEVDIKVIVEITCMYQMSRHNSESDKHLTNYDVFIWCCIDGISECKWLFVLKTSSQNCLISACFFFFFFREVIEQVWQQILRYFRAWRKKLALFFFLGFCIEFSFIHSYHFKFRNKSSS